MGRPDFSDLSEGFDARSMRAGEFESLQFDPATVASEDSIALGDVITNNIPSKWSGETLYVISASFCYANGNAPSNPDNLGIRVEILDSEGNDLFAQFTNGRNPTLKFDPDWKFRDGADDGMRIHIDNETGSSVDVRYCVTLRREL